MHHHGQDCLRLRVDVAGHKGPSKNHHDKSKVEHTGKSTDGGKTMFPSSGGVHNPSNRLPAGEHFSFKNITVESWPEPESSSAGCVYHEEEMMKSNWLPFLSPRWPRRDGAKCSEEYRSLGNAAGLPSTLPHHDPGFISADATLRLTPTTETISRTNAGHWGHRHWKDSFFIYKYMQIVFYEHG